jgi:hypothetical protein
MPSRLLQLIRSLLAILWGMLIGWLVDFLRLIWRALLYLHKKCCRRKEDGTRKLHVKCLAIPPNVYQRPDPLIYSQSYLMSLGMSVTWDNPDIWMERGGVTVGSHDLLPDTDYTAVAQIWNGSFRAPAVGMRVQLGYNAFGIGAPVSPIGETRVDLPVRGAPGHPVYARIPWHTPAAGGHYCLLVTLVWPDDENPANNIGQENTDVKQAAHGQLVSFSIPVYNAGKRERRYQFRADAYRLPDQPYLSERVPGSEKLLRDTGDTGLGAPDSPAQVAKHRAEVIRRNAVGSFPIPPEWNAVLSTPQLTLDPGGGEEITFAVTVPPQTPSPSKQRFNVYALDERRQLVGGVALIVEVQ